MDNDFPGKHDPYWYESSVGLDKVIDMLNPDNHIEWVSIQYNAYQGIDDVCVLKEDGKHTFYQVKHTITDSKLSFNRLIIPPGDKNVSLIKKLSLAWLETSKNLINADVVLYTNKPLGDRKHLDKPSLKSFYNDIEKVKSKSNWNLKDIEAIDGSSYFLEQLEELDINQKKQFISCFNIQHDKSSLEELESILVNKLKRTFKINTHFAKQVLSRLDSQLRIWSTTRMGDKKITRDSVWESLSISSNNRLDCFHIPTPTPFFESRIDLIKEIEAELFDDNNSVVFLEGSPGTGKSSIISKIANTSDSIITLKYYLFKPLTPEMNELPIDSGLTVKPEFFWGEMLNQLRFLLRGKLAEYSVPIQNDFLEINDLRAEVLRLCIIIASINKSKVVISIDGIDHAARSNLQLTLLNTLPDPNKIPSEIKFLISGQPTQVYDRYPSWLKHDYDGVKKIQVEPIIDKDIRLQVEAKTNFEGQQLDTIVKILQEITQGNTLSIIYAIEEITKMDDSTNLKEILKSRKLGSEILSYYDQIWTNVFNDFNKVYPEIDKYFASLLILTNVPVNSLIAQGVLVYHSISLTNWELILNKLFPLLISSSSNYTMLHNDFRVFLTTYLESYKPILERVSDDLYKFYSSSMDYTKYKHSELIRLKTLGNKLCEIPKILTDDYVLEAVTYRRPLSELERVHKIALEESIKQRDSSLLMNCLTSGITIDQFSNNIQSTETSSLFELNRIDNVLECEINVIHQKLWTLEGIFHLFDKIVCIYNRDHIQRAQDIFFMWKINENIDRIFTLIADKLGLYGENNRSHFLDEDVEKLCQDWGKIIGFIGFDYLFKFPKELTKCSYLFNQGFLKTSLQHHTLKDFRKTIKLIPCSESCLTQCLLRLLIEKQEKKAYIVILHIYYNYEETDYKLSMLCLITLNILKRNKKFTLYERKLIHSLKKIKLEEGYNPSNLFYIAIHAFLLGYRYYTDDTLVLVTYLNYKQQIISSEMQSISRYFTSLINLGRISYTLNYKKIPDSIFDEYRRNINILIDIALSENSITFQDKFEIIKLLFEYMLSFVEFFNYYDQCNFITYIKEMILVHIKRNKISIFFEHLCEFLHQCGEIDFLNENFNSIIGKNGFIWDQPIIAKSENFFICIDLIKRLGLSFNAQDVTKRYFSTFIGFLEYKDYSLSNLTSWLGYMNNFKIPIKQELVRNLHVINEICKEKGDNRDYYEMLENIIHAKIIKGPKYLDAYLRNTDQYFSDSHSIIKAFISYIESNEVESDLLYDIWNFVIGTMQWQRDYDRDLLIDFRNIMLSKLNELDLKEIKRHSPVELEIQRIDSSSKTKEFQVTDDTITSFETLESLVDDYSKYFETKTIFLYNFDSIIRLVKKCYPTKTLYFAKKLINQINKCEYGEYYTFDKALLPLIEFVDEDYLWAEASELLDMKYYDSRCLNVICKAISTKQSLLVENFGMLCTTYVKWITDDVSIPLQQNSISKIFKYNYINLSDSFSEIFFLYLINRIECRQAGFVDIALKGIYLLLVKNPSLCSILQKEWCLFSYLQKEMLLKVFQVYTSKTQNGFRNIKDIIDSMIVCNNIELQFLAYMVYKIAKNKSGLPDIELIFIDPYQQTVIPSLDPVKLPIKSRPSKQGGKLFVGSERIPRQKLEYLSNLSGIKVDYIDKLIQLNLTGSIELEYYNFFSIRSNGSLITKDKLPSTYLNVIQKLISNGELKDVNINHLIRLCINGDDPFIFLHKNKLMNEHKLIHNSNLDKLVEEKHTKEWLRSLIIKYEGNDEIIISFYASTFSTKTDVVYKMHKFLQKKDSFDRMYPARSYNCTSYDLFSDVVLDGYCDNNLIELFVETGGLYCLNNSNCIYYPSAYFNYLGLFPNIQNPTEYIDDKGNVVVWLETYIESTRSIYPSDAIYRYPHMYVWKIKKDFINQLLHDQYTLKSIDDLTVYPYKT